MLKLLSSELLIRELVVIPPNGATIDEISVEESEVGLNLSDSYRRLLHQWNGLNLDVIRFFGVGKNDSRIPRLAAQQGVFDSGGNFIFIASDPAGFVYGEDREGRIYSFDHDGGEIEFICRDFDSFVVDYLFGENSDKFMGDEWRSEVMRQLKLPE